MLDYESLKGTAKSIGRSVKDLLALSPGNDPFYAGIAARRQAGEWFAGIWAEHGRAGVHLRRLHYRLVSQTDGKTINRPDGGDYQNTEKDWKFLVNASLAARYLDLIDGDEFVDRRNDEPMLFATHLHTERNPDSEVSCEVSGDWADVDVPDMPTLPFLWVNGLDEQTDAIQDYIVEIWIEKSTQNDWLVPLCERRGVNLVVGIGEQSEIRSRELAVRASEYKALVRIIYLSDFDPGGRSMPKAVARKVEFAIAKLDLDLDLQLIPLALTPEQCRDYGLPRTPIKETEARKNTFERIFGVGATELDALEALHPGELARLLEAEIDNFLDPNLKLRVGRAFWDTYLPLKTIEKRIREKYAEEIEQVSERFEEIKAELEEWEEEASELWQAIAAEMEEMRPELSGVEVPRSEAPGETNRFVLFDSRRDYFTKMDAYNAWRDGDEPGEEAS
jgi:hypothetical protein